MNNNPSLTLDILREAIKDLREKDPLLRNGVQPDWVCVVNPAIVSHIQQMAKAFRNQNSNVYPMDDLHLVMGRRVFIIEDAPINPEYMPEEAMRVKYAEHFLRVAEWLAEQKKQEGGDES